jgi:2-polyprenyl-6-methoxyphenol hydroxylase-like FAD-dependent oxidoreductase
VPSQTFDTPVLIVGAGPVGTVLALELARHEVTSIVVERTVAPSRHPKMDYVSGRSMELLRRLNLVDAVRSHGIDPSHPTDFRWTRDLDSPPIMIWHHPSVAQLRDLYATINDGTAPTEPYQRLPGSVLEQVLREAVRNNPLVDLREGWTCTDLLTDGDGVVATVVDAASHTWHTIRARYLAGCDGARSTVRRCLSIGTDQLGEPSHHLSVYFASTDPALRRHGRAFVTIGARGVTLVSRDEANRWTASVPISTEDAITIDPVELIRERLGVPIVIDEVLSVSQWDAELSVANAYRKGNAFLVGDSAHQLHPTGGYGANTGIGDAVDLGWKLAAMVGGWGGPRLIDSYEQERRPVALVNRELCADLLGVWIRFRRLAAAGATDEQLAGILAEDAHHVDNTGVHFGARYSGSPVVWPDTPGGVNPGVGVAYAGVGGARKQTEERSTRGSGTCRETGDMCRETGGPNRGASGAGDGVEGAEDQVVRGGAPAWRWRQITASTWPGCRAPALVLADGGQLFDRFGSGFTLVDLSGAGAGEALVARARLRGIPMTLLAFDDAAVRRCWERDLVLVRPDHYVAWRDDVPPAHWDTVLDVVCGREAQPDELGGHPGGTRAATYDRAPSDWLATSRPA